MTGTSIAAAGVIEFQSDVAANNALSPQCGYVTTAAIAIAYEATQYLSPELKAMGYTADFRSDTVPEPATLALLSIGLAGLTFSRRQRKQ